MSVGYIVLSWLGIVIVMIAVVAFIMILENVSARTRVSLGVALLAGVLTIGGVGAVLSFQYSRATARAQEATLDISSHTYVEQSAPITSTARVELESSSPSTETPKAKTDTSSVNPNPLSITYPKDPPDWVKSGKLPDGLVLVSSGPQTSRAESLKALNVAMLEATHKYTDEYLGTTGAWKFLDNDLSYIKQNLVDPIHQYSGEIVFNLGPMHEEQRALRFDEKFHAHLDEGWRQVTTQSRLFMTLLVAGGVLGLLGTIFSYFRLDNATRGFYTGRLQFASLAAILAIVSIGVIVARLIPWL